MRWAIQIHSSSLETSGAIITYGNKWLVSEPELYEWLCYLQKPYKGGLNDENYRRGKMAYKNEKGICCGYG